MNAAGRQHPVPVPSEVHNEGVTVVAGGYSVLIRDGPRRAIDVGGAIDGQINLAPAEIATWPHVRSSQLKLPNCGSPRAKALLFAVIFPALPKRREFSFILQTLRP